MLRGFISFSELTNLYDVPENTLKKSCFRSRQGTSTSWRNFKVDNCVWIDLNSIPKSTRKKYNVPTAEEYELQKSEREIARKKLEQEQQANVNFKKLETAIINYTDYYTIYYDICAKKGLTGDSLLRRARKYAIKHSFWVAVLEIAPSRNHPLTRECHRIGLELTEKEPLLAIKPNYNTFSTNVNIARTQGIDQAISNYIQENTNPIPKNNQKFGEYEKSLAYYYFTRPQRYTAPQVTRVVNHILTAENKLNVSLGWIKTLRNSQDFKNSIERQSRGAKYNKDFNEPYLHRKVFCANRVWQMDGTPSQTMCWENGQWIRPYIFAVKDVFSKRIIGISISKSEDRNAVMTALQMAVEVTGQLANEIVMDNASAFKTDEMKEIQLQMEKKGVLWRFSTPENPQDKSQIERFWSTFQGKYENLLINYLGRGITTDASKRPSAYVIRQNLKQNKYTLNDMKKHLNELMCIYNYERIRDYSPNELYVIGENPNKIAVDELSRVILFFNTTYVKMSRCEVKITYKKQHYFFSVPNEVAENYNSKRVKVKYDPFDMTKIWLFDEIDNCLCECNEIVAVNHAMIDRTDAENEQIYKMDKKKKDFNKRMNEKHQKYLEPIAGKEMPTILSTYKDVFNDVETKQFLNVANKYSEVDLSTINRMPQQNSRTEFEKSDYDKTADLLSNKNQKKKSPSYTS